VTAVREVTEELGCTIEVTGWLPVESLVPTEDGAGPLVLRVAVAELVDGDPVPGEHDALRWLGPDDFDDVPWVEADVAFLDVVRERLAVP
jgi:8-oxo-dGTP diphosphatase